ncbi:MAG: MaoC/PaaZ C-terminal domain-containing protein [Gemmatimonadota bacterium]
MNAAGSPWQVGDRLEELRLPAVDRMSLVRYAGASGDFNPIHVVDEQARRTGLPGIIQHGMLTMAQMARPLSPYLANGYIEHFRTRFSGMLFLGDQLSIVGQVTVVEEVGDGARIAFDLQATTSEGRSIAKATLRFRWLNP